MMAADEGKIEFLLDREIPDGRKSLQDSYINLGNVAQYCETNYQQANLTQKPHALEETKNYVTHSLASVAYQINMLATNFIKLLDLQLGQLTDMESSVNHLNQMVMIHKEKVARREIGVLTLSKTFPKHLGMRNGVIYPDQTERPTKYVRTEIDYTVLDGVGHGLRPKSRASQVVRNPSVSSNTSSNRSSGQAPTTRPPATPGSQTGSGSSNRGSGSNYRIPAPSVAPPGPPPMLPLSPGASSPSALPPPIDDDLPPPFVGPEVLSPLPPPPLDDDQMKLFEFEPLPPTDLNSNITYSPGIGEVASVQRLRMASTRSHDNPYAATGAQLLVQGSLVPPNYIEKVVAIYDYQANKSDELSFAENAVIYVINKNDDGWWEGMMDGQTGLFPYNYVEPCM